MYSYNYGIKFVISPSSSVIIIVALSPMRSIESKLLKVNVMFSFSSTILSGMIVRVLQGMS